MVSRMETEILLKRLYGDNSNFYYLTPEEACKYAATDALRYFITRNKTR